MDDSGRTELLREVLGSFNAHDLDAIMAHFSEDCVFEAPRGPEPWGRRFVGKDEVRRGLAARFEGIPDVQLRERRPLRVREPRRLGMDDQRHHDGRCAHRGARLRHLDVRSRRQDRPQGQLLEDSRSLIAAAGDGGVAPTVRLGMTGVSPPFSGLPVSSAAAVGRFNPPSGRNREGGEGTYDGTCSSACAQARPHLGDRRTRSSGGAGAGRRSRRGAVADGLQHAREQHLSEAPGVRPAQPGTRTPGGAPEDRRPERRHALLGDAGLRRLGRLRGRRSSGRRATTRRFSRSTTSRSRSSGRRCSSRSRRIPITYVEGDRLRGDHPVRPGRRHRRT